MEAHFTSEKAFIVFSDFKGFSKIKKQWKGDFLKAYQTISYNLKSKLECAMTFNTWGDAIIASFQVGTDAVEFMLALRSFIFEANGEEKLQVIPRIAGHYGDVNLFYDPILGKQNILGNEVNTTARIEPVTRPGEVFVTNEFKRAIEKQSIDGTNLNVAFDELGVIELAKNFGEHELYRLRLKEEKPQIIDRLYKRKIENALPNLPKVTEAESIILKELKTSTSRDQIVHKLNLVLEARPISDFTGGFCYEIAKVCKKAGLYEYGEAWVIAAQNYCIVTGNISLYPYKSKRKVLKLKADLFTRLNKFEEAANILYNLWSNIEDENSKDASDILSMLAAQFKRRAILSGQNVSINTDVDRNLLDQALNLYLEAFRRNIEDFYPAINAAYLQLMLKGESTKSGKELATYIETVWGRFKGSNHWLDLTLAQCKLLNGDYSGCASDLVDAIEHHVDTIGIFDIESTMIQIEQYLTFMDLESEGKPIITVLENYLERNKSLSTVKR